MRWRNCTDRYGKTLKAVIAHVVHEEAEADDVLQEIFLQIWREASNYSPHAGKPLGWVVTLARRRAIDRLRRRQAYCRAKDALKNMLSSSRRRGNIIRSNRTFRVLTCGDFWSGKCAICRRINAKRSNFRFSRD